MFCSRDNKFCLFLAGFIVTLLLSIVIILRYIDTSFKPYNVLESFGCWKHSMFLLDVCGGRGGLEQRAWKDCFSQT